jgi:hypothetical protein
MCIESKIIHRRDAESAEFLVGAEQVRSAQSGKGSLAPLFFHHSLDMRFIHPAGRKHHHEDSKTPRETKFDYLTGLERGED